MRRLRLMLPVAALVSVAVALNYWSLRYPARIDLTSSEVYSISPASSALLSRIHEPVTITFFYDVRSRAMQDAKYLLEQYAQMSEFVSLSSHDPTLEPAVAERFAVKFSGTAVFQSGTRTVVANNPGETEFTNALIRVTSDAVGTVCFTDGHIESNPNSLQSHDHFEEGSQGHNHTSGGRPLTLHERHGMGMARNALSTLGYSVEQRLLFKGPDALDGCAITIVASPQAPFSEREVAQLKSYYAGGGPLLLLLEPGIANGLETLLAENGIAISAAAISDPTRHYWTDPSTPAVTDYARHRVTRRLGLSFFPGAAELAPLAGARPSTMHITALVETSDDASLAGQDELRVRRRTIVLIAKSADGVQRIAVAGDGDFATNSFFSAVSNGQLFLNLVSELTEHKNMVDIAPRNYAIASMRLNNSQLRATFMLTTVAGPLALLLVGLWVWRSRR